MADEEGKVTIADVLTGRVSITPRMKITLGQRTYYNYRCHQPSREREVTGAVTPHTLDFRSRREQTLEEQDS